MRALIQRVSEASVVVDGVTVGAIEHGLLILLGIGLGDSAADVQPLATKIANLRIFADAAGKFNLSLLDVGGAALVVSQFTLFADTRRGRRPAFVDAAPPAHAAPLVDHFCAALRGLGIVVESGRFGAMMEVKLVNQGPVTIWLDTTQQ